MSNELRIEDIETDNMDKEIHNNPQCHIEERDYTYQDSRKRTLKVCILFMVCKCNKKPTNPLIIFDKEEVIILGKCVDFHLHGRGCHYESYHQYGGNFTFKRYCYCRPSSSYQGR